MKPRLKKTKIFIGVSLVLMLGVNLASAQLLQAMRGSVKQVAPGGPGPFGDCTPADPSCLLRYEYWSTEFSAEINRDVSGIPLFLAAAGDYRGGITVAANYPNAGQLGGKDWYLSWFGELNGGTSDHVGYYSAMSQVVNFGENGNDLFFNCNLGCNPADPGCNPTACFRPTGNFQAHSVTRADGSLIANLGGLSPIPVPRTSLQVQSLIAKLEWDAATGVTLLDGAPNPVAGYRIWVAEDTNADCSFPEPTVAEYRSLGDVPAPATGTDIGFGDLDPGAEAVRFAIQLLYQSTANPVDAFERRSGYTLPAGTRVEGLSANGNLAILLGLVENFTAVDGTGNRAIISWDVDLPAGCNIIDKFVVTTAKDPAGLSGGGGVAQHTGQTFEVPFDGSTSYSITDDQAGTSGSKVNVYTITVVLTDGTEIVVDTIVFAHKGKTS